MYWSAELICQSEGVKRSVIRVHKARLQCVQDLKGTSLLLLLPLLLNSQTTDATRCILAGQEAVPGVHSPLFTHVRQVSVS